MKTKTKLLSLTALGLLVALGVTLYTSGSFGSLKGDVSTAGSGAGSLTVAVSSSTAKEDIVIAGASDVEVSAFDFVSTGEAFVVSDLSINNRQSGVTNAQLGDYDNNVLSLTIEYEDEDGNTVTDDGYIVHGTASFSGLDLYVPADDTATMTVYADLTAIGSSGRSATAGEYVDLSLAFDNFEAVGQTSGDTFTAADIDASVDPSTDFDFGTISWTDGSEAFELEGAQTLSLTLGSAVTLTVDNGSGDNNTNTLPIGSMLCVDDDMDHSCLAEDMYVVTAWNTGTGATDTVTALVVDDAGDNTYDDEEILMYALPGTGFLSQTNRMHVYESKPTLALSSSSPSGSRTVDVADNAFAFTVTADAAEKVFLRKIVIDMTSDADFNLATPTKKAYLKEGGTTVSTGTIMYTDSSTAKITFDATLGSASIPGPKTPTTGKNTPIEIAKGTTKTLTLVLDTATLLDEDAGVDDPLTFSIDYGSSSDGTVSAGDVTWSETNLSVKWLGNLSDTKLTSNTVIY